MRRIRAVDPIAPHDVRQVHDRIPLGDAEPEVVVLGQRDVPIAAELVQDRAAHRRRGVTDRALGNQCLAHVLRHRRVSRDVERPSITCDEQKRATDGRHVRVLVEVDDLSLQSAGFGEIVGVENGDVLAARETPADVQGVRIAGVALRVQSDALVLFGQPLDDLVSRIGRAVVDDDQLEVLKRLCLKARDGLGDEPLAVTGPPSPR